MDDPDNPKVIGQVGRNNIIIVGGTKNKTCGAEHLPLDKERFQNERFQPYSTTHGAPVWDPQPFLGFGIRPRYHSQAYDLGYLLISFIG